MGLIDDIKNEARQGRVETQLSVERDIEIELNKLFYAPKCEEKEVEFVRQMFTRGGESEERIGLHASSIIESENKFCVRKQVLSLLYKQDQGGQVEIGLKRIFEHGNATHEKWQRLFLRGGLCEPEDLDYTRFLKKYELSYTPDAIIKLPKLFGDERIVVEIKSVNPYTFKNMKSHPSGKKQCLLYMRLEHLKHGFVLAEDKGLQDFKVFYYSMPGEENKNKKITDSFIDRLEDVQERKRKVLEEHKMVARHCNCTSYDCDMAKKCSLRDACYNKGMGRIRL